MNSPPPADVPLASGFVAHTGSIGIKDDSPDLLILTTAGRPARAARAAGVFTRSLFSGPSVGLSRRNIADHRAQAVVVVSKNANVATGDTGAADAAELAELTATACGCDPGDVLVGSTGVIGVPYPMERVRDYFDALGALDTAPALTTSATAAARAIMTTDTRPKVSAAAAGPARVVGFAKGVGMIEPDMATMIAVVTTDAAPAAPAGTDADAALDAVFRRVVDRTFNALSVDTDTSTSDMAVLLASGEAGEVDAAEFERALGEVCTDLTRQLAADGEGAETLIVVSVAAARDHDQARRVAKSIVNSPLVKTAVHGRDPNWGRVAMAIGKCHDVVDIDPAAVVIRFGDHEVYPAPPTPELSERLRAYLAGDEVLIDVSLGVGDGAFTVYGCDLTDGYVRINADYTT
ncbi:MAG TPA: ornithine acetyltransferase [Acidimicrobiaceae bacterium]|nr:ornithine acetyltransferase [Acidimicrobiaceae bacterium]